MTVDPDQIRRHAEAATPGPWYYDGRDIFSTHTQTDSIATGHRLVIPLPETWHESQRVNEDDARYIAAVSPDVVLALLADLEQVEREYDNATEAWQLEIKRAIDAEARLAKVVGALKDAIWAAEYLADQQAMADDGYRERLQNAQDALAAWEQDQRL